ncbi:MAG TPA: sigma-70 family RNA polymerase sigma factor [Steroidobacteraceae bacterium]|nr:sigma-70 family RNA polymerase sigma factor [Steroidobacteraceae bacterium]
MRDLDSTWFERVRPGLMALAGRILRSNADAEDVVQETWLRWHEADRAAIESPFAWLATVCKRRCLDLLRSHHRTQVDYVSADLPEPVSPADALEAAERAASIVPAFDLALTRLSPKERAAWLLCEVFDRPCAQAAASFGLSEEACQKLVERARVHVARERARFPASDGRRRLVRSFQWALATGDLTELTGALSRDLSSSSSLHQPRGAHHAHEPQRTRAHHRRCRQDRQSGERTAELAGHRDAPGVALDDAGLRLDAA